MQSIIIPAFIIALVLGVFGYQQFSSQIQNGPTPTLENSVPLPPSQTPQTVTSEPQSLLAPEEEVITSFFAHIHLKEIPEAIALMSDSAVPDDATKQAWGVQFNAIRSVSIMNMSPIAKEMWTGTSKIYKVILEIYVDSSAAKAPIPYYGWEDNPNIRFITVTKNADGKWRIDQIGTGL